MTGTWIRFITRLTTEMGMALPFPNRWPSTQMPGTAGPPIANAQTFLYPICGEVSAVGQLMPRKM
jgi:hypothetical protein